MFVVDQQRAVTYGGETFIRKCSGNSVKSFLQRPTGINETDSPTYHERFVLLFLTTFGS